MTASSLGSIAKSSVAWSIGLSVWMILAGALAILIPPAAEIAVLAVVAWLLTLSGIAHLVFGWHTRTAGGVLWEVLVGVLYIFVGFYALLHPTAGLAALTLVLAAYLLAESVLEFVLAFQLRPMSGSAWLLFDGIITLILSVLIWASWPSNAEWAIGTLLGINMLFSGAARLSLSLAARRVLAKAA